jgi:tRNA-specific 2-thiouridylase
LANNVLIAVQGHDHPLLFRDRVGAIDTSWVSGKPPRTHWVYTAKIRYRQIDAPCAISQIDGNTCEIDFAEPQRAVTPGQSVVVYESRVCLGGGIIGDYAGGGAVSWKEGRLASLS